MDPSQTITAAAAIVVPALAHWLSYRQHVRRSQARAEVHRLDLGRQVDERVSAMLTRLEAEATSLRAECARMRRYTDRLERVLARSLAELRRHDSAAADRLEADVPDES